MKKFLFLIIFIISFLRVPLFINAAGASLYLSPNSGSFYVGSTFDVSIFVNTGGEDVNAIEVNLEFDPRKLQIASPTTGKSFIEIWVAQPSYSNTKGTMTFIGGIPTPGINTSAGLVSTVTFRAIEPGETSVVFSEPCRVLRNDAAGTDILTSKARGVYTLLIPPPEGPKVFSPTHPDQNKWYKNNNPTFSWEKEEKVSDFSFSLDQDSTGIPDNISEGDFTSISYNEVEDGLWYFHVKAKKEEVWGGTSHYLVRIDSTSPAIFVPQVEPSVRTTETRPLVSFVTTDAFSGIDFYQLKYIDIDKQEKREEVGFFTEVSSPHQLSQLKIGKYLIIVRAYDKAGNWREGTVKIQIFPTGIIFIRQGIQFRYLFFPWWLMLLILFLLLLLLLIYLFKRRQSSQRKEKEQLDEIEKKLEDYKKRVIDTE